MLQYSGIPAYLQISSGQPDTYKLGTVTTQNIIYVAVRAFVRLLNEPLIKMSIQVFFHPCSRCPLSMQEDSTQTRLHYYLVASMPKTNN